jgi:tRNA(Ile)-lysidine synthase
VNDFTAHVARYIEIHGLMNPGDRVLVGLSGGPDSVALLHALKRLGHDVVAAHLDHGWRIESADEAAWVAARCAEWGVPCHVERMGVAPAGSMEEAAREARYAFLDRVASEAGCGAIATGHHADDQAETLIFRLARGTGPAGLVGMRPRRLLPSGMPIVRPLLAVSRAAIMHALEAWGLPSLTDPTNADLGPSRNRIRHQVMPALASVSPDAARHMAKLSELVREEEATGEEEDRRLAKYLLRTFSTGWGELDRGALLALPLSRRRRLVRWVAGRLGAPVWDAVSLERLLDVAAGGGAADLAGGWRVTVEDDVVVLDGNFAPPEPVSFHGSGRQSTEAWGWAVTIAHQASAEAASPTLVRFDPSALPGGLVWRTGRPDTDAFRPWGHREKRSLRHFLARADVPRRRQGGLLVLAAEEEVLWVVGVRRGAAAAVSRTPEDVWEMQAAARFWV